MSTGKERFLD